MSRSQVRALDRRAWAGLTVIGVIGGSVPFILFFSGLAIASAPTAAFIHKTLFVWVVVLAVPFLGERLGWFPLAALGVLLAGQFLAAPPTGVTWGTGETMILAATALWAVEVVIARRLLVRDVPSPLLGAARLGIGLVVLVGYLAITGRLGVVAADGYPVGVGPRHGRPPGHLHGDLAGRPAARRRDRRREHPGHRPPIATAALTALVNGTLPAPTVVVGQGVVGLAVVVLAVIAVRSRRERVAVTA